MFRGGCRGKDAGVRRTPIALADLSSEDRAAAGVMSPATWLSPDDWIERVRGRGIEFLPKTEEAVA